MIKARQPFSSEQAMNLKILKIIDIGQEDNAMTLEATYNE